MEAEVCSWGDLTALCNEEKDEAIPVPRPGVPSSGQENTSSTPFLVCIYAFSDIVVVFIRGGAGARPVLSVLDVYPFRGNVAWRKYSTLARSLLHTWAHPPKSSRCPVLDRLG